MSEQKQESKPIVNPFEIVGIVELAPSGKSIRIEVEPENSIFHERYYIGIEALEKVLTKKKQTATVYILNEE